MIAPRLSAVDDRILVDHLNGPGLWFDLGGCSIRVHSNLEQFAANLKTTYGPFPVETAPRFADVTIQILKVRPLLRRRPYVRFLIDGEYPFDDLPAHMHMALMEWGANWCIAQRSNTRLMLHAGVIAHADRCIIMPAESGSGKSTLTAALMCNGYRLMSDEFCPVDTSTGAVWPLIRPVCLKNDSIGLISARWPQWPVGPVIPETHKGTIAHFSPSHDSVEQRQRAVMPSAVIFPKYIAGHKPQLAPVAPSRAFIKLSGNSFNYEVLGPAGFAALSKLANSVAAYELRYSDLDDAFELVGEILAHDGAGKVHHG